MKEMIDGFQGVILLLVVVPMTIYMFVVVPIGLIAVFFDKEEKFKNLLDRYMMVFAGPVILAKVLLVLPLWLAFSPIFWIAERFSIKTQHVPAPERPHMSTSAKNARRDGYQAAIANLQADEPSDAFLRDQYVQGYAVGKSRQEKEGKDVLSREEARASGYQDGLRGYVSKPVRDFKAEYDDGYARGQTKRQTEIDGMFNKRS